MVYLTGDIHGNLDCYREKLFRKLGPEDVVIVLGDFGYSWNIQERESFEKLNLSCKIISILGNHENYSFIYECPIENILGAKCYKIFSNCYHVKNGEILILENLNFFCFGGALSIDKGRRVVYSSWWPEEIPSYEDYENAIANLESYNYKIDFFLAHTCPTEVRDRLFKYSLKVTDPTEKMISQLEFEIRNHNKDSYRYFFGHHHSCISDGKYTCLFQQVMKLEDKTFKLVPLSDF